MHWSECGMNSLNCSDVIFCFDVVWILLGCSGLMLHCSGVRLYFIGTMLLGYKRMLCRSGVIVQVPVQKANTILPAILYPQYSLAHNCTPNYTPWCVEM